MKGPGPTARDRRRRREKRERQYKVVCAEVDTRDGPQCRACKGWGGEAAHHHHILYRSHRDAHTDTARNIIRLCARCHDLVHQHKLVVYGTTADTVAFWVVAE
jgi:5-methylcytosine-specific restriction endonuclease McrA